jgi:hypothetical protein
MRKLVLVVAALGALCVFAATSRPPVDELVLAQAPCAGGTKLCLGDKRHAVRVDGVLEIDSRTANAACDGGPGICFTGKGTLVYDFASLGGVGQQLNSTICAESSAGTATGCRFGDTVTLGIDQVYVSALGQLTAYVSAADAFKVVACANGISDGGSFNMPDASYTVRCFR